MDQPKSKGTTLALAPVKVLSRIIELRGVHVMLDSDLAELYGVETKILNKAVKRNTERFPADFVFQLTTEEHDSLRFQFGTSNSPAQASIEPLKSQSETSNASSETGTENLTSQIVTSKAGRGGRRYLPYVFTEQGVAMLSGVLRSERAVAVNIAIMRAFVELRRWARTHEELAHKLATLERKSDAQYREVMQVLERLLSASVSTKRIGFRKQGGK